MVALSGRTWRLAPCLVAMVDEANRIAPRRIRTADGSIGDAAHSARTSDHNPGDGWVCAVDLTHAPASGFDAHARARMAVARRDPRIKYVISNRQIARGYDKPGVPAWTWTAYTGSNAHTLHAHFSVHNTATARDDLRPWWPLSATPTTPPPPVKPPKEDDVHPSVLVVLTYNACLGRNPSMQEIANGINAIDATGQLAYVESIANSDEAKARRSA